MKVATRLAINAVLPAILAAAVISAVAFMNHEIMTAQRDVSAVSGIKDGMLELNLFTTSYLLDPRQINEQVWLGHYESTDRRLSEIDFSDPDRHTLLARIRQNYTAIGTIFSRLVASHSGDTPANSPAWLSPLEQQLVHDLRANISIISSDITRLTSGTQQKLTDELRTGTIGIGIFTLIMAALIASLLWKINRRIAAAIGSLERGTELIASGNLESRVGTAADDEIGRLSRSFDRMTEQLRATMVSRDALAREIEERKHAEQALQASEANYRAIFDSANDAIFIHDIDTGAIIDVNQRMREMYKYTSGEIKELSVEELSSGVAGYRQQDALHMIRLAAEGRPQVFEWIAKDREGKQFWVEVSLKRISLGGTNRLLAVVRDISQRKRADDALKESEERFRAAFAHAPIGMVMNDLEGRFLHVNQAYCDIVGYTAEELLRTDFNFQQMTHPDDLERNLEEVNRLIARKAPAVFFEKRYIRKDGRVVWARISATVRRDAEQNPFLIVGLVEDITGSKRAAEMNARLSAIIETAEDAIISESTDGIIQTWNRGAERMYGFTDREAIGKHITLLAPEDRRSEIAEILRKVGRGEPVEHFETVRKRKDGTTFHASIAVSPIVTREGGITGASIIAHDITDRVQAQETLKLTQFAVDHASVSVFFVDRDARILYVNEQTCQMLGYSRPELLSMAVYDLDPHFPLSVWPDHWSELKKEGFLRIESQHRKKDGTLIPVELSINYLSFAGQEYTIAFGRDVSERKRAENELSRAYNITKTILDSVNDAISLIDVRDFTIVAVNKAFLKSYGYSSESEIARKHCYAITHQRSDVCSPPDDICPLIETVKTKEHFAADHVHYDRHGRKIYVEVSTSPIRDEAGNVVQVVHLQRDITERKRAEEALRISESRFRNLFQQSPLSMQVLSPDGRTLEVNHAFEELWGLELAALKNYNMLSDEQLASKGIMPYIQKGFAGEATEIPIIYYNPSEIDHAARARWVKSFIYPVTALEGKIHQVVLMHWDVTEMVKAQSALLESENRFRAFFESAAVGTVQLDAGTGKFLKTNQRFCDITGYACEELQSMTFLELTHPDDRTIDIKGFRDLIEGGQAVYDAEKRYVRKDGSIVWVHISASVVRDAAGRPMHTAGVVQDITARKQMEEEIRHMAQHDALTGLPNRRLFIDILNVELAMTRRHRKKMAILFLDLDRFKEINDTLGHTAGDELLKQVAGRFRSTIRASDTVARIGGDEFNIVLSGVSRTEDISDIARKIVESFKEPLFLAGRELHITTSIGISIYPDDSEDVDTLLRYADIAMYHSKTTGRNRYSFFNPAINIRSLERMKFENYLRHTIDRHELLIQYQPEVEIATGKVVCVEALVRWRHPERGMLEPGEFIPIAEETGYIADIDHWVLRKGCEQLNAWAKAGLDSFCLSVNLSARQFQSADLPGTISRILRETGTDPRRLVLEVTEGTAMSNMERTKSTMQKLSEMGVRISIDDFGTGCSSLNYLRRLPVERLKIDQSFIQDIASDPDDRAIVLAISAMAHSMKMKVIAEGVETEEQLAFVREAGCEEMQGFLFSEPVSPDKLKALMGAK